LPASPKVSAVVTDVSIVSTQRSMDTKINLPVYSKSTIFW